ncbi:MAG: hypothetical protein ACR2PJ_05985, partial [Pseudomonadales bacterium]
MIVYSAIGIDPGRYGAIGMAMRQSDNTHHALAWALPYREDGRLMTADLGYLLENILTNFSGDTGIAVERAQSMP